MDVQKEKEIFDAYWEKEGCNADYEHKEYAWQAWQAAKAQAMPENKIEFDGEYIKYPNNYAIHCQFDEDFDCHIFDVYQNEDCVKDGMTQLKQAHLFVFSMIDAQEPK